MLQDALNHVRLAALDEADDLHLAATLRAFQRIDFVDALDEHGPNGRGFQI